MQNSTVYISWPVVGEPIPSKTPVGIRLIKCSNSLYWYSSYPIGTILPFVRVESDCYISREPAGYINIVNLQDGELVYD
jgi:hypothetical protein